MLTMGIVGLGRWGQRLVDAVQGPAAPPSERLRFVAGTNRSPEKAADFCSARGLRHQRSLDDLPADPAVDAVALATPHSRHAEQIAAALAAGKHVFCEKPLTMSLADAREAYAAADAAGRPLCVGFNRRFLPAYRAIHEAVFGGDLGTVLHVEGNFSGNFGLGYGTDSWRAADGEAPAGGLTLMGIHVLDLMVDLMGPVETAFCDSRRHVLTIPFDDTTQIDLRFRSGLGGYISTLTATPRLFRLQVFGTQGWLHLRDHHLLDASDTAGGSTTRTFEPVDIERAELEAFARAVTGEADYPVTAAQAVHVVAAAEAIIHSAETGGSEVRVP